MSNVNCELTLDAFSRLSREEYKLNSHEIRRNIMRLMRDDGASVSIDRHVCDYYSSDNPFIWISRLGAYERADTLLSIIQKADYYGIDTRMLRATQIEKDLERIRTLHIDDDGGINKVMARLEYNLTRAYFRYAVGMRYGFVNPDYLYNRLEEYAVDSTTMKFRQLSDLRVERPGTSFYESLVSKAFNDGVGSFLSSVCQRGELYDALIRHLNSGRIPVSERWKTLCNIERCRWRLKILEDEDFFNKYVEVNIPSFSLRAYDKEKLLYMRVGCGTKENKTPILSSYITRMDVNPQWILPKSIAKGIVGSVGYMRRMGMFVLDKKKGKLPPEEASYNKVINGEQYIVQKGGPKNSLGRIIFRFDNNFSVFLHDTSSPWLFQRGDRAVSHGCIRVEKPYELALFLLGNADEELVDRLKYSMTVEFPDANDSIKKVTIDRKRLVNSVSVKPSVPLFITYYTVYWNEESQLADFPDVYGFDEAIFKQLEPFMK